jgi:hypothetical protein
MSLFIGFIILILAIVGGVFGGATFKRNKNAKLCQAGYYCVLIGPDRVWMKVLPAENGLIVKPEGENKKKFYNKKEPEIPWSQDGYIVPRVGPVPTVSYPIEASSMTQVSVGMLIYHVGCAMPLGYDKEGKFCGYGTLIGAAPEVIGATYKSRDTMDLFNDSTNEPTNVPTGNPKFSIWNILTLIGIAAILILLVVVYFAVTGGFTHINNGFGL